MSIASVIDHTVLGVGTTEAQIRKLCTEAVEHGFASVCVNPTWVCLCSELLGDTDVAVCSVIGFPLGATLPKVKAMEVKAVVAAGADEVDMVLNIGLLKSGKIDEFEEDIMLVRRAARGVLLKVIIETCLLTREEKVLACRVAMRQGADFVKTSTGFSGGGATLADVHLMREVVGSDLEVKASGGIRDYETAKAMIEAGATRLGCSAGVAIVTGEKVSDANY